MIKKLIPKNKQKLVYLKWQDAHANANWFSSEALEEEINKEMFICEEVGWIVYEDKDSIHIIARRATWKTNLGKSDYGLYQRIPKAWIMKRRVIIK